MRNCASIFVLFRHDSIVATVRLTLVGVLGIIIVISCILLHYMPLLCFLYLLFRFSSGDVAHFCRIYKDGPLTHCDTSLLGYLRV